MSGADRLDALKRQLGAGDPELRRVAVRDLPMAPMAEVLGLLVGSLDDTDWRVRKQVIDRLVDWPDVDAAVAALIGVLAGSDDVGARNAAIDGLAQIGDGAVEPMVAALPNSDERMRKFLVDGLGLIGDERAVPALLEVLRGDDTNLCVAAAEALGRIGGGEAERALVSCLEPARLHECSAALDALARLHTGATIERLAPCLAHPMLRAPALLLLGWVGVGAAPQLLEALGSTRSREQLAAVRALATLLRRAAPAERAALSARLHETIDERAADRLLHMLRTADIDARNAAAAVLGSANVSGAPRALAEGMMDIHIAPACVDALVAIGAPAIGVLVAAAADADTDLRLELFEALARIGKHDPAAERMLAEAMVDESDEEIAAAAARALADVGSAAVLGELQKALSYGGTDLASAAATALGRLGGPRSEVRMWLSQGLASDEPAVRAACALALGELGDVTACTVLQRGLSDADTYARLAAIRGLASLGPSGLELLRERLHAEQDTEMVEAIRAALATAGDAD